MTISKSLTVLQKTTHTGQLDTPERLRDWLVERSLLAVDATIDERAHRETLEFRKAVRALALTA